MPTIDAENAKQIRTPFEVHCALYSNENATLTPTISGNVKVFDSNIVTTLNNTSMDMRTLADLSDGGFSVDGSAVFYDGNAAGSLQGGKLGIRTDEGGAIVVNISADTPITAVTINVSKGSGTVTANGVVYEIRTLLTIPVGGTSITLTFNADAGNRIEISTITAGFSIDFTNDNLIGATVSLRSDLSVDSANWQTSEIEIKAYYPDNDDMAQAISNVSENAPITYYCGYPGDYSEIRRFYLDEHVSIENNVITIKGVDLSSRLIDSDAKPLVYRIEQNNSLSGIYYRLDTVVSEALGYSSIIHREAYPPVIGYNRAINAIVWEEEKANELVAKIMHIGHKQINGVDFHPSFIDAGIPTLRWSKPVSKWNIYEEDCADVTREIEQKINSLSTNSEEYTIEAYIVINAAQIVETQEVEAGQIYEYTFNGFSAWSNVSNGDIITSTPERIVWKARSTGSCNIWSQPITTVQLRERIESGTVGISKEITPYAYGYITNGDNGALLFPDYSTIFSKSNESGTFTFKGDPRMQPRDVFTFHPLIGSPFDCTIESITLSHENGGTSATISYRKGVL